MSAVLTVTALLWASCTLLLVLLVAWWSTGGRADLAGDPVEAPHAAAADAGSAPAAHA